MSDGQYLTLVYKIESEGQRKALIHGSAWCAKSDTQVIAERDKLRAEYERLRDAYVKLQANHILLGGERNKTFDECEKLKRENEKLQAYNPERTQTMHIGIRFNDAEFVRSMQTLIAEHTSDDAAQLHEAKQTIERLNDELGRVKDQCAELKAAQLAGMKLVLKEWITPSAKHQPTELSMAKIVEIVEAMPNGVAGFLRKWGLTQFARAVWAAAQKGGVQ